MSAAPGRIAVFGAGLVGAYLGGRLAAAGVAVTLVGRRALRDAIAADGLAWSDLTGARGQVEGDALRLAEDAAALADAALILVTVKSGATAGAAEAIARHAAPDAVIVSFQNGIGNDAVLRAALPGRTVLAGMVPFNVARLPEGRWHQGTSGRLAVADDPAIARWAALFAAAGLPLDRHADMAPIAWAKLVLNLNNAVNALSGVTLSEELARRGYRRVLAAAQREALATLEAAGIVPARTAGRPLRLMPLILGLPDPLYRLAMARAGGIRIDPLARSSMADDLAAGRATEVDHLNGAVVALAARLGRRAPVNAMLVDLVHAAERGVGPIAADQLVALVRDA